MPTDPAAPRARFLDIEFDGGNYEQVVDELERLSQQNSFSFVVTPNVDHVLMLHPKAQTPATQAFQQAYAAAAMKLCDSRILQRLARRHDVELHVVTGSDLTAYLFQKGHLNGRTVAIVGGDAAMVPELHERFPAVRIVQHRPPMGVLKDPKAVDEIIAFIEKERAQYVLLAIGAPQSEIVAHKCLLAGKSVGVGLCIGASIEFLLDRKKRAPVWMQRLSLEWFFRLINEPRRLWKRYVITAPRIFVLAWQKRHTYF